jgi:hypothetical protein
VCPNIFLSVLFNNNPNLCFFFEIRSEVSHKYKTIYEISFSLFHSYLITQNIPHKFLDSTQILQLICH